mmetsp:Transcript_3338/g.8297  ORF Transcript_3338/g.8297 Transcript_3338/m.8297 type:complete len:288 (+) Transcript_3338:461-1324(+)
MHVRTIREEHLREALCDATIVVVPAGTLHEEAPDIATGLGFREGLLVCEGPLQDIVLPTQRINGQCQLTREVLQDAREEGLREEETRDPVDRRMAFFVPVREERQASDEVRDVGGQRLQGGEGHLHPMTGPGVPEDACGDLVQTGVHDNQALHRLAHIRQRGAHPNDELVETKHLLVQNGVQRLVVVHGVLRRGGLDVERLRDLAEVLSAHLRQDLVRGLASLAAATRALHAVGCRQHRHDLVDRASQIRIGMQAEDLRVLIDGQALDVVNVAFFRRELRRIVGPRR